MSIPPWLLFLLILALAFALAYSLARARYGWRVGVYWLVIAAALLAGEAAAESAGLQFGRMGDLRLLPDIAAGLLAMLTLRALRV